MKDTQIEIMLKQIDKLANTTKITSQIFHLTPKDYISCIKSKTTKANSERQIVAYSRQEHASIFLFALTTRPPSGFQFYSLTVDFTSVHLQTACAEITFSIKLK